MNILLVDVFPELEEHWRSLSHRVEACGLRPGWCT